MAAPRLSCVVKRDTALPQGLPADDLVFSRGVFALCGPNVELAAAEASDRVPTRSREARVQRDGPTHHITVLTKDDISRIVRDAPDTKIAQEELLETLSKTCFGDWVDLGLGNAAKGKNEAFFKVIIWPSATAARQSLGLEPVDFHITVGFTNADVHGVNKGPSSLLKVAGQPVAWLLDRAVALQLEGERLLRGETTDHAGAASLTLSLGMQACSDYRRAGGEEAPAVAVEVKLLVARSAAYGRLKSMGAALADAEHAISLDGQSAQAYARAGSAAMATRDKEAARRFFQAGLDVHRVTPQSDQLVAFLTKGLSKVCDGGHTSQPSGEEEGGDDDEDRAVPQFRFPRTRHIIAVGKGSALSRDDLLLDKTDAAPFFGKNAVWVSAEEKVDGANLGLSVLKDGRIVAQNRSHYVNSQSHSQFKSLDAWISTHQSQLQEILRYKKNILFGEWVYAKHSLHYTALPGYFIAFDIWDCEKQCFYAKWLRDALLASTDIPIVPCLFRGVLRTREEVEALLSTKSRYRDGYVEGTYIRIDEPDCIQCLTAEAAEDGATEEQIAAGAAAFADPQGEGMVCVHGNVRGRYNSRRGKVVREDFIEGIGEHWMTQTLTKNVLRF